MPLKVTVGPNRDPDSLHPCCVNVDSEPTFVSSEHFEGFITVRIKNHQPASQESGASTCSYFDNHSRVFSLQWQGRFKATNRARPDGLWTADDVLFAAEVENSIKPPPGLSIAKKFMQLIDPSLCTEGILNNQRPWIGSYLVTAMNVLRVWNSGSWAVEEGKNEWQQKMQEKDWLGEQDKKSVGPWYFFGRRRLEEGNVDKLLESGQEESSEKEQSSNQRRKFFMSDEERQRAVLDPKFVIAGDFFNNFTDFESRRARMVVSINMERVVGDQAVWFVCRSRCKVEEEVRGSNEVVFFVVQLDWV